MASHSTSAAGGGSTMPRVQTEVRGTGSPLAEEIAPEDAVVEVRPHVANARCACGRQPVAARTRG